MSVNLFEPFPVRLLRKQKVKTPSGSYKEGPEAEVDGSPFLARFYRKRGRNVGGIVEGAAGVSNVDNQQAVAFEDTSVPVKDGDIILLPPGVVSHEEARAKVLRPRFYPTGIQCDIETGAV